MATERAEFGVELTRPELLQVTLKTRARMRRNEFIACFARAFPLCILILTPVAIFYRWGGMSVQLFSGSALLAVAVLFAHCIRAYWRGPSLLAASLQLERRFDLKGTLSAALGYCGLFGLHEGHDEKSRVYAQLVLQEVPPVSGISPAQAVPLWVPAGAYWGGAMACFLALLLVIPLASEVPAPLLQPEVKERKALSWVEKDDADILQRAAKRLDEFVVTEQGQEAAQRFNEIVIRAVSGEITQTEAFQMAAKLEADLKDRSLDAAALRKGLAGRGESLSKRVVTRKIGDALQDERYKDAADALKKLSERLSQGKNSLSKKELDELRAALQEVRKNADQAEGQSAQKDAASDSAVQELTKKRKRLLEKKKAGSATNQELNELKKVERELARLSRKKKAKDSAKKSGAKKALSELDKQLAEAARALQEEQKKSGEFLDQAGKTVSREAAKQLSDDEKRELVRQLKELKERLRRQNKGGKKAERLRQFQKRARGAMKKSSGDKSGGQQGQAGKKKSGPGQIRLGPGGQPLPGQGEAGSESQEGQAPSQDPGTGHDPKIAGEESGLSGAKSQDVTAVAQDSGEGESASETIVSAAESGFTASTYERLYREYETVAEEVMEKEKVPVGRKFHVLRYFELIRPREMTEKMKEDK